MDKVDRYRQIIKSVLNEYAELPRGELSPKTIFDDVSNRYLLMVHGWWNDRRMHYCVGHLEIINDKIWIHHDGTEDGIADDLERYGIPKSEIVLGFHEPKVRKYTEYAAA